MKFRSAWSILALVTLVASATCGAGAATPGGTTISNTVTATYSDGNGNVLDTASNTVVATVATVSGVGVTPNENGCNPATDALPVGSAAVKTFTITNSSNASDAFTINATTTGGTISSISLVSNGQTTTVANGSLTPTLAPGASVQIVVNVATTTVVVGSTFEVSLQATSTATGAANGTSTSTASQCVVVVGKAVIGGAGGPASQVRKLVDNVPFETVKGGQVVVYSIAYENYGGVPATGAVLTDTFPTGVTPAPDTIKINGVSAAAIATLNGQTLSVQLGSLAPNTLYTLTISATVSAATAIGTELVNTAQVSATNAGTAVSSPAAVLDGVANVVYDGYVGSSLPVSGAIVSLVDPKTGLPITLAGTPIAPNTTNVDPYTTGTSGTYAFGLGATQIGPITYDIVISAPGYLPRKIQVVLTPDATGTLYSVTITALDGQLLAVPGGFALTAGPVMLPNVTGLFGNIPLFRAQAITIQKQVDRTVASGGDRLVYTIDFSNVTTPLGAATLVDTLPTGVAYAPGTALVDGIHVEPVISGRTLTWTFPTLVTKHEIRYAVVIIPGVTAGSTLTNSATVTASPTNVPSLQLSATASVDTAIIQGIFTDQIIITGRVFIDSAGDGWVHKGDLGIPGVRIFLEDGENVVTDANGRYSFPGVRPGMHVLKLDRTTLPTGTKAYDDRNYDSQKSIRRLVHGVFDGGTIQDVNFAIEATR